MTKPIESANDIFMDARAFWRSRIVHAAYELDLFSALGDGPRTSAQVAASRQADPRGTDRLMNALVTMGYLAKTGDEFANTPVADRHLVRGRPGFLGGLGHSSHLYESWLGLPDAVRHGGTTQPIGGKAWEPRRRDAFIEAMHARAVHTAPQLASAIPMEGVRRVLDVGGGSGVFAMAIARAHPGVTATVLDLPAVTELTRGYVEREGMGERVDTADGDYHVDPFPGGFDLVLLSAIVHSNGDDENRALIAKCAGALNPGGAVVVSDYIMDDDRVSPPGGAMFALNMLVNTPHGDTFTEGEVRSWMTAAGLSGITRSEWDGGGLMIGRKGA